LEAGLQQPKHNTTEAVVVEISDWSRSRSCLQTSQTLFRRCLL